MMDTQLILGEGVKKLHVMVSTENVCHIWYPNLWWILASILNEDVEGPKIMIPTRMFIQLILWHMVDISFDYMLR